MERVSYYQRKKKTAEYAETMDKDFWMLTFSDLLQLLLTFFVLLISMSSMDTGTFREMFRVFGGSVGIFGYSGGTPVQKPDIRPHFMPPVIEVETLSKFLQSRTGEELGAGKIAADAAERKERIAGIFGVGIELEQKGRDVALVLSEDDLFESGAATLSPGLLPMLDNIVSALAFSNNRIIIEGHTDDAPIRSRTMPSNWELSAARASAVLGYLAEKGIDSRRMEAKGYASHRPRVRNIGEAYRKRNRRIEIVIKQLSEGSF